MFAQTYLLNKISSVSNAIDETYEECQKFFEISFRFILHFLRITDSVASKVKGVQGVQGVTGGSIKRRFRKSTKRSFLSHNSCLSSFQLDIDPTPLALALSQNDIQPNMFWLKRCQRKNRKHEN